MQENGNILNLTIWNAVLTFMRRMRKHISKKGFDILETPIDGNRENPIK